MIQYLPLFICIGYIKRLTLSLLLILWTLSYVNEYLLLQTNPPEYTDAAEQCISARNSFFADSTCLANYLTLSKRSTANTVNSAATAICRSQRCKNRMSSYTNFLTACQVDYFVNGNHVCMYVYVNVLY